MHLPFLKDKAFKKSAKPTSQGNVLYNIRNKSKDLYCDNVGASGEGTKKKEIDK